jgi:hypothetical protein
LLFVAAIIIFAALTNHPRIHMIELLGAVSIGIFGSLLFYIYARYRLKDDFLPILATNNPFRLGCYFASLLLLYIILSTPYKTHILWPLAYALLSYLLFSTTALLIIEREKKVRIRTTAPKGMMILRFIYFLIFVIILIVTD